jgi:general secretion pathway protein G
MLRNRPARIIEARKSERAVTFIELMFSISILPLLASMAVPAARVQVQRQREMELRRYLRMIREAIDTYKGFSDRGIIPVNAGTFGYPSNLQTLVDGVPVRGAAIAKY